MQSIWEDESFRKEYNPMRRYPLFVYGTMKRGFRNHARVNRCEFLGTFRTRDAIFDMGIKRTSSGYFAPVLAPNGCYRIEGELYMVRGPILMDIDFSEGHPFVYKRIQVELDKYPKPVHFYHYGYTNEKKMVWDGTGLEFEHGAVRFAGLPGDIA